MIIKKVDEETKREQNKATITRRIYECMKVMKIIGVISKTEGGVFKYNSGQIDYQELFQEDSPEKITLKEEKILKKVISRVGGLEF
jgi:hypothetical protein